jgi:hypothetical protein
MTQNNLGNALVELGKRGGHKADVEEGREGIAAAWEAYRAAGHAQYDEYFRQRIAEADRLLAAMK